MGWVGVGLLVLVLFGVLVWALLKIRGITDDVADAPPVSADWQREQGRRDSTGGWTGPSWDLDASRREAQRARLREGRRTRRE